MLLSSLVKESVKKIKYLEKMCMIESLIALRIT